MMTTRAFFSLLLLAAALVPCAHADINLGQWKLMGEADVAAGQYFFKNKSDAVNAYSNVRLQQARSFSNSSGLYFTENSIYTGFKQLTDLAGGGIVFQQSLMSNASVKYIKRFEGGYSLKPRAGFTNQLFKETNDEPLGKGIYDFNRIEAGLTWERKTRLGISTPWTYQLSYDAYYTHYPRLKSLASSFGAALAAPDPGKHLLDTFTHQLSYRSDFDLPNFQSAWFMYSLSLVNYTDQKIVNQKGEYLAGKRTDAIQTLQGGWAKRLTDREFIRVRPTVGMGGAVNINSSNQNNFDSDPSRLKYIGGYYNYYETHLSPSIGLLWLDPMINTRLTYDWSNRQYTGRFTQNADASYNGAKLYQMIHTMVAEISYSVFHNLDIQARLIYASTNSNTKYEQVFIYNYWSTNYYAGIVYRL